jgi:molecular chaperone DnaK (HSP70)
VTQAVITVPAYFNDAQRQATKDAGRMAGLEVLRLVNEPTAAALAYGLDKAHVGTIAVYDLGGGTFDISILKFKDGIFEVQSTNGDTHLGGDDIDNLLLTIALDEIHAEHGIDLRAHPSAVQAVRKAAIEAKIKLSSEVAASFDIELPNGDRYQREIPRAVFELLMEPILERTAGPCKQALADAGLTPEEIDEVVLVGGSTRIPAVRQLVDDMFHLAARGKKPHTELNPDEVVALGAAVQADILAGDSKTTEEMLLLDVTPLSLGIEALGGTVARIIERNSTVPASATEHFTTGVDGQTNVAIHVVQGERELASDCRSLARFDLKGIPPMSAGLPRIEVRFLIDADGILQVTAKEQRSGKAAEIEVKPTYGLTDEQVESMILDSFDHAEEDFGKRLLIEARNEAETILAAVDRAPQNPAWAMLSGEEQAAISAARGKLEAVKLGQDASAIRAATLALDQTTRRFAELMMDAAVTTAIRGKTMGDAGKEMGDAVTAPHAMAKAEFK